MSDLEEKLKPGPKTSWDKRVVDFWHKVNKTQGCWLFTGSMIRGYGQFHIQGKGWQAHRLAYTLVNGYIPEGLELDHLCRVRNCVNPAHLEPVEPLENKRRSPLSNISKTHCKRGHEFTPNNTVPVPGGRGCRTCRTNTRKEWYARQNQQTSV